MEESKLFLFNIYDDLKKQGRVKTQRRFSVEWLGCSPKTFERLINTARKPPMAQMMALYVRLADRGMVELAMLVHAEMTKIGRGKSDE